MRAPDDAAITLRLSSELREKVAALAAAEDRSLSSMIRLLVWQALAIRQKEESDGPPL